MSCKSTCIDKSQYLGCLFLRFDNTRYHISWIHQESPLWIFRFFFLHNRSNMSFLEAPSHPSNREDKEIGFISSWSWVTFIFLGFITYFMWNGSLKITSMWTVTKWTPIFTARNWSFWDILNTIWVNFRLKNSPSRPKRKYFVRKCHQVNDEANVYWSPLVFFCHSRSFHWYHWGDGWNVCKGFDSWFPIPKTLKG